MSEQDRGAYTPPTEAPLTFDPRQPVRGARPWPWTMILSLLVLMGLVAVIVVFYRSGVRQAGQAPQTIGTPLGALKGPAPAEAQPQDPAAGLQIYKSEASPAPPAQPQFVAPPEQPQPRPTPQVVVRPPALPPTQTAPVAAVLKPAPLPQSTPASPPVAAAKPPPAPPPPKVQPAPSEPKSSGGAFSVQIGAYSSRALADRGWSDAAAIAPGTAAGKGKRVEQIEKDGETLYRTAVTGFSSRESAAAFCGQLKAAGKSCFVK